MKKEEKKVRNEKYRVIAGIAFALAAIDSFFFSELPVSGWISIIVSVPLMWPFLKNFYDY